VTARLTAAQARRVALGATGLAASRPAGRVDRRHLDRVLDRIKVIQVDSVNVLVRSQELPLWARLGPHSRRLIPDAVERGDLFEYWAHEAALVPRHLHPAMRYRMARARTSESYGGLRALAQRRPEFITAVLDEVRQVGPIEASKLSSSTGKSGSWWGWDDTKAALEYLFWTGELTARRRPNNFAREYALPAHFIDAGTLALRDLPEDEARRLLLMEAADALGVATLADLADYFRQKVTDARPIVADLVRGGDLIEVGVEGWKDAAYALASFTIPRTARAATVLSPFDPVVWFRPRAERLFNFEYRIEIYTPAPKRTYGYYVLPFLLGDQLVGRLDLKADRAAGSLLVQSAWIEPDAKPGEVAVAMATELTSMAEWLGLDSVTPPIRGTLAAHVSAALAQA
jgi:uncharacterized protein